jgi:transposase-like protein
VDVTCPACRKSDPVFILDKGIKRIVRAVANNSRFACMSCMITWRYQKPIDYQELAKSDKCREIVMKRFNKSRPHKKTMVKV